MTAQALLRDEYYVPRADGAFACPGGKQLSSLAIPAAERYYVNNFDSHPPFILTGPLPDRRKPDVWAVYRAATAAKYEVYRLPGLVMSLYRAPDRYLVLFDNQYHHRFNQATGEGFLCTNLAEFVEWLGQPRP